MDVVSQSRLGGESHVVKIMSPMGITIISIGEGLVFLIGLSHGYGLSRL